MLLGTPAGSASAVGGPGRERQRQRVVRLVMAVYLLLILEGVLRKWLLPAYSQPLFFIRDPLLLAAYAAALAGGLWPRGQPLLVAGIALGTLAFVLATAQLASGSSGVATPLLFAAYGWRNYFLYLPLPFIVAVTFGTADVERLVRWTLWFSLPIAALVIVQFYAPLDSWINVGTGEGPAQQFIGLGLAEDHTRPMGPFTSNVGQREFTVSGLALLLALWATPAARRAIRLPLLLAGSAALLVCLAFSGSRGVMVHGALLVLVAVGAVASGADGRGRLRSLGAVLLLVGVAVLAYPLLFPESYHAFMTRWDTAAALETQVYSGGILGRALYGFIDFARLVGDMPLLGYGLGLGGNASTLLGVTIGGSVPLNIAETDWARHIVDLGPVAGLLFIVLRVLIVGGLAREAWRALRRNSSVMPALLFGFAGVELLYGQITAQGSVNGYTWLFAGLCLAATVPGDPAPPAAAATKAGAGALPRFPNLMR